MKRQFQRKRREDPDHHTIMESSLIESLNVKMVSQVVLDPMHLVDIGVMKKILINFLKGLNHGLKLTKEDTEKMLEQLLNLVPLEFGRKPRSFEYVESLRQLS